MEITNALAYCEEQIAESRRREAVLPPPPPVGHRAEIAIALVPARREQLHQQRLERVRKSLVKTRDLLAPEAAEFAAEHVPVGHHANLMQLWRREGLTCPGGCGTPLNETHWSVEQPTGMVARRCANNPLCRLPPETSRDEPASSLPPRTILHIVTGGVGELLTPAKTIPADAVADSDGFAQALMGQVIYKTFLIDRQKYQGVVSAFDEEEGWYTVTYSDREQDEFTLEELRKAIGMGEEGIVEEEEEWSSEDEGEDADD